MARREGEALVQRSQNRLRPVVPRADALADGVPEASSEGHTSAPEAGANIQRTAGGHPANHDAASKLGQLGGLKTAARRRREAETPALVRKLGLRDVSAADLLPYLADAEELAEHECARLAQVVGGGHCGTAPSLLIQTACLQVAGSRYAFARGDLITGSRLGDAARANMLSAHELCAKEGQARPQQSARDALTARILASNGRAPK